MAQNNLKKILVKEGHTQAQLASTSSLSEGTVNKICNLKRTPSPTTMVKLVKALNKLAGVKYRVSEVFPQFAADGDDEEET